MTRAQRIAALKAAAKERILILDGAWGVMIQRQGLAEADYRGERFKDHATLLKGDNDVLCLTWPDIVADLHDQYYAAELDELVDRADRVGKVRCKVEIIEVSDDEMQIGKRMLGGCGDEFREEQRLQLRRGAPTTTIATSPPTRRARRRWWGTFTPAGGRAPAWRPTARLESVPFSTLSILNADP